MSRLTRFLFPVRPHEAWASWLLLLMRLFFGILLLIHGLDKWIHFEQLEINFPDPLGVGSRLSLMLALFAEVFCACFVILGVLTRLMLIPIVISMFVAFFVVHQGQSFAARELSFIFMIAFLLLMIFGPGRYSFDSWIGCQISPRLRATNLQE